MSIAARKGHARFAPKEVRNSMTPAV